MRLFKKKINDGDDDDDDDDICNCLSFARWPCIQTVDGRIDGNVL